MSAVVAEILRQERAAVFFHAPWSGPSVLALTRLRSIGDDDIRVVDVDVETGVADILKKEGYSLGGWGEVAVIRSGVIRYFVPLARDVATLDLRIAEFLDEKRA
jgi:hypothetical protein